MIGEVVPLVNGQHLYKSKYQLVGLASTIGTYALEQLMLLESCRHESLG